MLDQKIKKVVLAYSGGLDTSVILAWLRETWDCEVVCFTADLGQGEELAAARSRAETMGVREVYVEDLTEEFARDYVYPMFRANTLYEGEYLLGTAIARPLITKRLMEIAALTGADAIAHGATGKGNDQLRFELGAYALNPRIKVIAPWRLWSFHSRQDLLDYAADRGIAMQASARNQNTYSYSTDANLLHISYEGGPLEDPWQPPEEAMWSWTRAIDTAPDVSVDMILDFAGGDVIAIDGKALSAAAVLRRLNEVGGLHGVGRSDIVENRCVGMKSRGCYETPGGALLLKAHRAIESLTLDRELAHLKDELMPRYARMIYNGYWWSPERRAMQALIDETQTGVNGQVCLRLHKGNVIVRGRRSAGDSLFQPSLATFEDDAGSYDQQDADGFIKLNALRLKLRQWS